MQWKLLLLLLFHMITVHTYWGPALMKGSYKLRCKRSDWFLSASAAAESSAWPGGGGKHRNSWRGSAPSTTARTLQKAGRDKNKEMIWEKKQQPSRSVFWISSQIYFAEVLFYFSSSKNTQRFEENAPFFFQTTGNSAHFLFFIIYYFILNVEPCQTALVDYESRPPELQMSIIGRCFLAGLGLVINDERSC